MKPLQLSAQFLCLILLCSYSKANAQEQPTEARIDSLMQHYKMVGISVAVVKKEQIIYTHAFGLQNIATNTPLNDSSLFRIASISKSFSATAIMQLVQAKKLSLNDDVSKLIGFPVRNPKFPQKVITLRMLMSHTSSINDSQGYFTYDSINPAKSNNWAKCYNNYAPGEGYEYCNYNYNMVGAIIEKVFGERFDQYIKTHILDPSSLIWRV